MQRRFFSFVFAAGLIGLCFIACSGEGEGQRCELTDDRGGPDNSLGSSDCSGNLVCTPATTLGGQAAQWARTPVDDPNFGICCPQNRQNATTSVCAYQPSPPGGDASIPGDSGTTTADGSTGDAGEAGAESDGESDSSTGSLGSDTGPG